MLQTQSIYSEISAALRTARSDVSPVIEALRLLGVRNDTIAKTIGISPSMVSLWSSGREPIAAAHFPKLIELLRMAHAEAIKALGEVAARTNAPDLERSFRSYRDRVRRAGEILEDLDQQ